MTKAIRSENCTVCKALAGREPPRFSQAGDRAVFCSFECMIDFALTRIRERRVHHNEQMAEMRTQLRDAKKRRAAARTR